MSQPPSDKPPYEPTQEPIAPLVPESDRVKPEFSRFGLSAKQFVRVKRAMLVVARKECRHSDASAEDAVQLAFVKALSKPSSERQSIDDDKKFTAWLCELAMWEAVSLRTSQRRRAAREMDAGPEIAEQIAVAPSVGDVEARMMLDAAIKTLKSKDQAVLHALYAEGKTIADLAREHRLSWSAMDARHKRILGLLHAAIQAGLAALMLLVPKKARAFVANITQQVPQALVPATHLSAVMAVTAVCGVLLPTGSSAMAESSIPVGLTTYNTPQTLTVQTAGLPPSFLSEVEPEEPKVLDTETNQCSAAAMKSTQVASFIRETIVPVAFVVAPALTQVACSGTTQQTPAAQQGEEESAAERKFWHEKNYRVMCDQERARGNECPTMEEWEKD